MKRPALVEKWYKEKGDLYLKHLKKTSRSVQDAEDVFQDAMVQLLTIPADWNVINKSKVIKWTRSSYYCKDCYFSVSYEPLHDTFNLAFDEKIEDQLDAKICLKIIQTLVEELPAKSNTKKIFIARFLEDRDYLQISQELGIPRGSCRQLGSRAADIIKEKFNNYIESKR